MFFFLFTVSIRRGIFGNESLSRYSRGYCFCRFSSEVLWLLFFSLRAGVPTMIRVVRAGVRLVRYQVSFFPAPQAPPHVEKKKEARFACAVEKKPNAACASPPTRPLSHSARSHYFRNPPFLASTARHDSYALCLIAAAAVLSSLSGLLISTLFHGQRLH